MRRNIKKFFIPHCYQVSQNYIQTKILYFNRTVHHAIRQNLQKKWFGDNNIKVLSHPSSSPDLNPIETLWHKMKQHLRNNPQRTIPQLRAKLQEIWDNFPPNMCEDIVDTMPARIKAVVKANGDVTSY